MKLCECGCGEPAWITKTGKPVCPVKKRLYEEAMEKFGPGEESWEERMAWVKESHTEHLASIKERKLRNPATDLYAIDKIIVPELGHLKPAQVGPDRVARLIRDLEERGLQPSAIRRYLVPLTAIFKLAIRRGIVHTSPMALLSDEERPMGGGLRDHYVWSPEEISRLIDAARDLGQRPDARSSRPTLSRTTSSSTPKATPSGR